MNLTDEQKAAVERLRAGKYDDHQRQDLFNFSRTRMNDCAELAHLYLAEHPADDDELVTEEAVVAMGWENIGDDDCPVYRSPESGDAGPIDRLVWEPQMGCDGWGLEWNDKGPIPPPETMVKLRSLCRGLGIPLQE